MLMQYAIAIGLPETLLLGGPNLPKYCLISTYHFTTTYTVRLSYSVHPFSYCSAQRRPHLTYNFTTKLAPQQGDVQEVLGGYTVSSEVVLSVLVVTTPNVIRPRSVLSHWVQYRSRRAKPGTGRKE